MVTNPATRKMPLFPILSLWQRQTWLQVIKLYGCLHGFDEVLAANRKRSDSLSANKVSAVKGTWFLYTEIEGLSKPYAGYCLFWQMFHAVLKRIGKR